MVIEPGDALHKVLQEVRRRGSFNAQYLNTSGALHEFQHQFGIRIQSTLESRRQRNGSRLLAPIRNEPTLNVLGNVARKLKSVREVTDSEARDTVRDLLQERQQTRFATNIETL